MMAAGGKVHLYILVAMISYLASLRVDLAKFSFEHVH